MNADGKVTQKELGKALGWSDGKVTKLKRDGALPEIEFSSPHAWRVSTIEQWLDAEVGAGLLDDPGAGPLRAKLAERAIERQQDRARLRSIAKGEQPSAPGGQIAALVEYLDDRLDRLDEVLARIEGISTTPQIEQAAAESEY